MTTPATYFRPPHHILCALLQHQRSCLLILALFVCALSCTGASDEDPLQDFCVALPQQTTLFNGLACKNPLQVTAADFASQLLRNPGDTSNKLGSSVTLANALTFAGLNTLGLSVARIDFAPHGVNPPHVHPRASEVLFVAQGTLYMGFVSTANTLFAQTLYPGDLFVFPRGLVHFQLNVGKGQALAIAALNSQNPGASQVAKAVFAAQPPISDPVLETTFNIDNQEVERLRGSVAQTL